MAEFSQAAFEQHPVLLRYEDGACRSVLAQVWYITDAIPPTPSGEPPSELIELRPVEGDDAARPAQHSSWLGSIGARRIATWEATREMPAGKHLLRYCADDEWKIDNALDVTFQNGLEYNLLRVERAWRARRRARGTARAAERARDARRVGQLVRAQPGRAVLHVRARVPPAGAAARPARRPAPQRRGAGSFDSREDATADCGGDGGGGGDNGGARRRRGGGGAMVSSVSSALEYGRAAFQQLAATRAGGRGEPDRAALAGGAGRPSARRSRRTARTRSRAPLAGARARARGRRAAADAQPSSPPARSSRRATSARRSCSRGSARRPRATRRARATRRGRQGGRRERRARARSSRPAGPRRRTRSPSSPRRAPSSPTRARRRATPTRPRPSARSCAPARQRAREPRATAAARRAPRRVRRCARSTAAARCRRGRARRARARRATRARAADELDRLRDELDATQDKYKAMLTGAGSSSTRFRRARARERESAREHERSPPLLASLLSPLSRKRSLPERHNPPTRATQDLRGNLRVFCRVRPPSSADEVGVVTVSADGEGVAVERTEQRALARAASSTGASASTARRPTCSARRSRS